MPRPSSLGNRVAPARFLLFFAILAAGWAVGIWQLGTERGVLAGFDVAALAFLVSCIPLFRIKAPEMRKIASENDANRVVLLAVTFLLSLVILAAIVAQLATPETLTPLDKGLLAASLVLVWTFGNAVYTLHYAHLYYSRDDGGKDRAGLDFPGGIKEPDVADFAYFAYTLGVAVQTADVAVTSPHIRRVVTVHCVAGFFFNLGVLALTINVLGST